jgi:hypothetical protein
MNKTIMLITIFILLLQGCAKYVPVIDTKGKAKFETSNASEISDDLLHCSHLAKENSTLLGNINFWLSSPEGHNQYANIYKKCMEGRNHQVLK